MGEGQIFTLNIQINIFIKNSSSGLGCGHNGGGGNIFLLNNQFIEKSSLQKPK